MRGILVLVIILLGTLPRCASNAPEGGNSNWLHTCGDASPCDVGLACLCGVCTKACDTSADCETEGAGVCADTSEPAWQTACGSSVPSMICTRACTSDGDCAELGLTCSRGTCTPGASLGPSDGGVDASSKPARDASVDSAEHDAAQSPKKRIDSGTDATDGDATLLNDASAPLDCEGARSTLASLDTPLTCATDVDCPLFAPYITGGYFVTPENEAFATELVGMTDPSGMPCFAPECSVDGLSARGRCRAGQCERLSWCCNCEGFNSPDAGLCGPAPSVPLVWSDPSESEWDQVECMIWSCWEGSVEYDIGFGVRRLVEVVPGDAGPCTIVITEQDAEGWGQQKICPGPSEYPPAWWHTTEDYFVLLQPEDCSITAL